MKSKTPKYIFIKEKIKEDIKKGLLIGKLPGERVLANEFDVSYMTVRKAISLLVEEGILHKLATKGTFVSDKKTNTKITNNIGFFLDRGIKEGVSSPYYSLVFNELEKRVKSAGYNLILFSDFDDLDPLNSPKKVDGVIISCFPRIEHKIQEIKKTLPIVLMDNISSDKSIPSVTIDNFNSSSKCAEYLISLGHKQIAFVSGLLDSDICKERLSGYLNILNKYNIKKDDKLIFKGDYSFESGEKAARYFLSLTQKPTAIMFANDSMAIGAMKVIQENKLNIPKDISIVGFDDIDVASRVFPPLTTIAAPIAKMIEKAVHILIQEINGHSQDYQHIILPADLVIRNSCALPKK